MKNVLLILFLGINLFSSCEHRSKDLTDPFAPVFNIRMAMANLFGAYDDQTKVSWLTKEKIESLGLLSDGEWRKDSSGFCAKPALSTSYSEDRRNQHLLAVEIYNLNKNLLKSEMKTCGGIQARQSSPTLGLFLFELRPSGQTLLLQEPRWKTLGEWGLGPYLDLVRIGTNESVLHLSSRKTGAMNYVHEISSLFRVDASGISEIFAFDSLAHPGFYEECGLSASDCGDRCFAFRSEMEVLKKVSGDFRFNDIALTTSVGALHRCWKSKSLQKMESGKKIFRYHGERNTYLPLH